MQRDVTGKEARKRLRLRRTVEEHNIGRASRGVAQTRRHSVYGWGTSSSCSSRHQIYLSGTTIVRHPFADRSLHHLAADPQYIEVSYCAVMRNFNDVASDHYRTSSYKPQTNYLYLNRQTTEAPGARHASNNFCLLRRTNRRLPCTA